MFQAPVATPGGTTAPGGDPEQVLAAQQLQSTAQQAGGTPHPAGHTAGRHKHHGHSKKRGRVGKRA
jgi:hypothetical protein